MSRLQKRTHFFVLVWMILVMALLAAFGKNAEASTNGHSASDAIAWCESQVGKALDYDGIYGAQCVDFIAYYYRYLGQSTPGGSGKDYAANALPSGWSRVAGGVPQAGDILVYAGAKNGHVAIYGGGSTVYDQNITGRFVSKRTMAYNHSWWSDYENGWKYYWGYIRPDWVTGNSPEGVVDEITGGAGYVRVRGWAFDRDALGEYLTIHVYIGDEGHVITANKYRPDVDSAYTGVGINHGFEENIGTSKTGTQNIKVYAINTGSTGGNVLLMSKDVTINPVNNPVGAFDSIEGKEGGVRIRGWAYDEDDRSKSLDIHVYIGTECIGSTVASTYRKDVNDAYPGVGNYHGYDAVITTSKRGTQTVSVYAINTGFGTNILLGSKEVYIDYPSTYKVSLSHSRTIPDGDYYIRTRTRNWMRECF